MQRYEINFKSANQEKVNLRQALTAKNEAEVLRDAALEDLEVMQKRTQYELISTIVKVALYVIVGVGIFTTIMYGIAIVTGQDTQIIGSTWSNMVKRPS